MMTAAIGHSCDPNTAMAIAEVLEQCDASLKGLIPKAGILFSACEFDHALILSQIQSHFPNISLIGCTSYGEVTSILGFEQDSIALLLLCSDTIDMQVGVGRNASKDPLAAAQQAIQQAMGDHRIDQPKLCITTPESLTISCVRILNSLQQVLGKSFPIMGGFASEPWTFKTTYQFFNDEVLTDSIPVLLLFGDVKFSSGIACGWEPIGKPAQITKVEGNILYELDGKPALEFCEHSLGGRVPSAEYPLAIFEPNNNELFYLRGVTGYNRELGTVNALADFPQRATVQIAQASRAEILSATKVSIQNALQGYPGQKPAIALFFTCCCRQQILGTYTKKEFILGQEFLGNEVSIFGFYTYGEIAPLVLEEEAQLHQMTIVTILIGDG